MHLRRTAGQVIALAFLFAAGCGHDVDQLTTARHHLRPAPCADTPAVTAVASVHGDPRQTYLGDWLLVSVCHLDKLVDSAAAAQAPITLFIEGMDSSNEPLGMDLESGTLTFVLDRNVQNRELWKPLLYDPLFDRQVAMRISVGVKGERPLPRVPHANLTIHMLKLYVDWTTWVWLALLVAFTAVLFLSAARTDLLREGPAISGARQPYSLGRSQMAWWFFFIVLGYVVIWLVTGDQDTIPPSLLGLMGISAATALVATAIAARDGKDAPKRASRGWWRDLVADDHGVIALDRLQIVVWTVVLSGIFLHSVVWELTMPEFNATMLALMGISSGTYIGFKLPQKREEARDAAVRE